MINFFKKTLFIILALVTYTVQGQVYTFFNHLQEDALNETEYYQQFVEEIDNRYFVSGWTINISLQEYDKVVWILDSVGNYLDTVYLDTSNNISTSFQSQHTIVDSEDNFLIAYSFSYLNDTTNGRDYRLAKVSPQGELLWQYDYGNEIREFLHYLEEAKDGGYLMIGSNQVTGLEQVQPSKLRMIRVSEDGEELWDKEYGWDGYYARGLSSVAMDDGGFLIGAGIFNLTTLEVDNFRIHFKIDNLGNIEWEEMESSLCGVLINQFPDGSYLYYSCDDYDDYGSPIIKKLDESFNVIWEKTYVYNEDFISTLYSSPILYDDGSFVSTVGYLNENGIIQCKLVSFDSEGEIEWMQSFDTNPNVSVYLSGLTETSDGGYMINGTEWGFNDFKAITIKTDCMGNTCSFVGCDSFYIHNDPINPPFCEPITCFAQIEESEKVEDSVMVGESYLLPYLTNNTINNFSSFYLIESETSLTLSFESHSLVFTPDTLHYWGINIYAPYRFILDSLIAAEVDLEEIISVLDEENICYAISNNPFTLYVQEKVNGVSSFASIVEKAITYPNPATTSVTFIFPPLNQKTTLHIYNALGQLQVEAILESGSTQIHLGVSNWVNGIYYWKINGFSSGKLFKT